MKLKKIYLDNFRHFENTVIDFDEKLNVIIGQNDIGKSTVLEALGIFLSNEITNIDISDYNVHGSNNEMTIGCTFEIEEGKEYIIDTIPTDLGKEYLLNKDGFLEIHQTWDCSKSKLTAACLKIKIVAYYPKSLSSSPIANLKIDQLKKTLEEYSDYLDVAEVKKNTSSIIRQAIYGVVDTDQLVETEISLSKDDGKKIWDSLKNELPNYFLFQSDRINKDTDKEVQQPLKAITQTAIDEVVKDLEIIKKIIEEKAIQIGKETIQKLEEMNPEIAKVLKPEISNKAWDSLFSFTFNTDDGIPVNKRGSGIKRLIFLNYFRAEAERKTDRNKNIIYAIEEPETSQHPNHQTMLIKALMELSQKDKTQVLITTHTPEIAKIVKDENLIFIEKIDNKPHISSNETKLKKIADTLGVVPYFTRLVICVEGENDIKFIRNINQNIQDYKDIIDLEKENINIIPLIGGNLKNWVDRNYLEGSNITEFHIYDRDSNSGKNTEQYIAQCKEINERDDSSVCVITIKRELENYIPKSIIEEEFNIDCGSITDWDNEDIPTFIKEKKSLKEKDVKEILNGKLSKQITKEHLETNNSFQEIKAWFEQINSIFES